VIDWAAVREGYPGALRRSYLDTACRGLPPPRALDAIEDYCARVAAGPATSVTADTVVALEQPALARRRAAELVGAHEDEIALVESTQHGVNAVAGALSVGPGDNVVCTEIEFIGPVLPWRQLGAAVKLVPTVRPEDFAAAIDGRTRAVVVSSVQEVSGERVDLAALGEVCRGQDVLLVVDGTQHVGPVPIDVGETPVDVLAVGAHKWVCSPFGLGFVYVRRALLAELEPTLRGYMTLAEPAQGWTAYLGSPTRGPLDDLGWIETAQKLELGGTGPYLAAAALAAALESLLEFGSAAIAARVEALTSALIAGLDAAGIDVVSPRDVERRSGIVVFDGDRALLDRLERGGVATSLRFSAGVGGIRASPYFYNDESDVERLVELSGSAGARARRGGEAPQPDPARAGRQGSPG